MIIFISIGLLLLYLAFMIGVKKKISWVHDYHIEHIESENIVKYARLLGLGIFLFGLDFLIAGILLFQYSDLNMFIFFIAIIPGISTMIYAQFKYNGSIFS